MVIKPKVKGFICVNAHPAGCHEYVDQQVSYASECSLNGPKRALIIGSSSGYGLASRIALAMSGGADTIGVHFDRAPSERKTAGAGWYNNQRFERLAKARGLMAESLNVDAFQDDAKAAVIEKIKQTVKAVDLIVYSVAAPRRYVASEDKWYSSVLKPIGRGFKGKTIDTDKGEIKTVELKEADQEEIDATVKVMGGEDWLQWIEALNDADVLADGCKTIAYTYIGDEITWPIYGDATIGQAKKDLDKTVTRINTLLHSNRGRLQTGRSEERSAYIGVLKALVTQSSAAIPVMPLYISLLYKVMKEQGSHEGCIEQILRILTTGLYGDNCQKDSAGRLRVDEHELTEEVQSEVKRRWERISNENLRQLSDFEGYRHDFLKLFGFGFQGIDYEADVEAVPSE
ncbi:enoyl-ACP reductase FabV [Alkalimarinus alittae]|uniref:Enoyl-[acyl-carrier-protein] reductase [NADH] n=1 Tax=Alkalimarinus alittae TaxID=2961619 RepID=A0ABY6MZ19_9ALTE|nr:enoyl-ACP reductase FabV [Alkalimarinus alittae]UZE95069.1 trans-2-enoyl-CoA reductase family protein [Alkalimarinus alittae]